MFAENVRRKAYTGSGTIIKQENVKRNLSISKRRYWGVRLIQKILAAVDGSEPADKALEFALDLAEKYSAQIVLLNVFHIHIPFYYTSPVGTAVPLTGVDEFVFR